MQVSLIQIQFIIQIQFPTDNRNLILFNICNFFCFSNFQLNAKNWLEPGTCVLDSFLFLPYAEAHRPSHGDLQCQIPLLLSSALVPQYLAKQPSSLPGILMTCSSLSPSLSTVHNVVLIV